MANTTAITKAKAAPASTTPAAPVVTAEIVPVDFADQLIICKTVADQVGLLSIPTPPKFIKKRKGRGGDTFDYIETSYVIARLNATFFYNWDVEVVWQDVNTKENQVAVQIRLTVRFADGRVVRKMAYGSSEVKRTKVGAIIDLADDLKAAQSDGIKKAASMLGIGWDVYAGLAQSAPAKDPSPTSSSPDKDDFLDGIEGEVVTAENAAETQKEAFRTITLVKSNGRRVKVSKFEALDYFKAIKQALGEEAYYTLLKLNGYKKSNEIPPAKMASIYTILVDAWKSGQEQANV